MIAHSSMAVKFSELAAMDKGVYDEEYIATRLYGTICNS